MELMKVRYPDPFSPVLLDQSTVPSILTLEQQNIIREILEKSSSDSLFAQKAYNAISIVLKGEKVIPPVVTSLTPSSAKIGDPSFTLSVKGTGFNQSSVIIFAGNPEPTTFVSDKEVSTGVDMSVWLGPDVLPVLVQNSDGSVSDPMMFTFNPSVTTQSIISDPIKHQSLSDR